MFLQYILIYNILSQFLHRYYVLGKLKPSSQGIFPEFRKPVLVINFKIRLWGTGGAYGQINTCNFSATWSITKTYLIFHTAIIIWDIQLGLWSLFFNNPSPERGEMVKIRGRLYKNKCLQWRKAPSPLLLRKNSRLSEHKAVGVSPNRHFQQASLSFRYLVCCFDQVCAPSHAFPICLWSWRICHLKNLLGFCFPCCS